MERRAQTILTAICGSAMVLSWFNLHPWLPYVAVAAGSWFALKSAWEAIAARELDVNLLMVLAAAGAIALNHPGEAAVLLFLFSLSNTLESYALSRTKSAIEALVKLRPEKAILVLPDGDQEVLVKDVQVGSLVRVLPFQAIPIDGQIASGETSVDQAAMTGESVPVAKVAGDPVLAGTQNMDGMIVVEATRPAGDTTLEKIVDLVRDAQENKASGERISQWFGQRYTFFVLAAFGLSLVIRLFLVQEETNRALYASLTLLVALSPCALVISSPAASLSALAWAARKGILVRGGEYIELAGRVDTLCIDKTGTLTSGKPKLSEICVCQSAEVATGGRACKEADACWHSGGEMSPDAQKVLRIAAAAEQYSTHPLAEAIVKAARDQGLDVPEADEHHAHSGLGVSATVENQAVKVGQRRFFEQDGATLDPDFAAHVEEIQRQGMTVAILEFGEYHVALGLRDEPRPEAKSILEKLKTLGINRTIVMTGDTRQTADAVGAELGVTDIRAGLLPADKEEIISGLEAEGRKTMMVGDGINDAPSLARATLGVAMGGLGSDIAMNAADVVLMQDKLERLPELVGLGRKTNRIIRANLFFAGSVIAILTVGSVLFDALLPGQRNLILPIAVIGHEGSTVLVILNGLRLLRGPQG